MVGELYLCGTSHLDLAGPERLKKLLDIVRPDTIAIESYHPAVSEHFINLRREWLDDDSALKKYAEMNGLCFDELNRETALAFLGAVGYEVWVPFEYASARGTTVVHLEDSSVEKVVQEVTSGSNADSVRKFISELLRLSYAEAKTRLDEFYTVSPMMVGLDSLQLVQRNGIWAEKIRKLSGTVLMPVGRAHVYGREPNLQTLLGECNLRCLNLIEADHL